MSARDSQKSPIAPTSREPRRKLGSGAVHGHDHCEGHGAHLEGLRLTPGRRAILDLLCEAGRPLGAYEMIDRLGDSDGRRPAPISVYRALDYLLENGLVHRLATRNAYLACAHRHDQGDPVVFLICEDCNKVEEATSARVGASLADVSDTAGFRRRTSVIEVAGVCAACADESRASEA